MACAPSEDSDQPGHSVIRVFAVCMKKAWGLSYSTDRTAKTLIRLGECQADLSRRWAHMPFYWFCRVAAHMLYIFTTNKLFTVYPFFVKEVQYALIGTLPTMCYSGISPLPVCVTVYCCFTKNCGRKLYKRKKRKLVLNIEIWQFWLLNVKLSLEICIFMVQAHYGETIAFLHV